MAAFRRVVAEKTEEESRTRQATTVVAVSQAYVIAIYERRGEIEQDKRPHSNLATESHVAKTDNTEDVAKKGYSDLSS